MRMIELTEQRELALKAVVYGCNTNTKLKGASFMTGIGSEKTQTISFYEALSVIDKMMDSIVTDKDLVPQGHWVSQANKKKCSVCEFVYYSNNEFFNFCPSCGARMKGAD